MLKVAGVFVASSLVALSSAEITRLAVGGEPLSSLAPFAAEISSTAAADRKKDGVYVPRFDGLKFVECLVTAHR
ncbi:unnamed protein product [Spirodela intermedia]|uniref:Uncharacterized protein n=1 Tax=Spirodela intermedia TaxID=51605 RepID=A0A7I8K476_SPIIN|nr:unnamed protein product [Spirodela intermedia]